MAEFESYKRHIYQNLAYALADQMFLDRLALTASLDEMLLEDRLDALAQSLREQVGDGSVLAVIGEIKGLSEENNPSYEIRLQLPSYYGLVSLLKQAASSNFPIGPYYTENKILYPNQAYFSTQILPVRFYEWGEFDTEKRIIRFWKSFVYRISLGDSIAHALKFSILDSKTFGFVSKADLYFLYITLMPNAWTDNLYSEEDDRLRDSFTDPLYKRTKDALEIELQNAYKKYYPEEYEADKDRNLYQEKSLPPAPRVSVISGSASSSWMLYAGLAAFGTAFVMRGKKK